MLSNLFGRNRQESSEARARVAAGATLLDVRTPGEFAEGHVAGAVNIPVQELGARIHEVPTGQVVVYCRRGGRSATAAALLRSRGYDVLDIGPMSAW